MKNRLRRYNLFICTIIMFLFIGIGYLYSLSINYPKIEFLLSSTNPGEMVCVYYDNDNIGFDEEHMIYNIIEASKQKYSFHIPKSSVIRIDFGESVGITQLEDVVIRTLFTKKEISPQFISNCNFSIDVGKVLVDTDKIQIESIGADPCVVIGNINEISTKLNGYSIVIVGIFLSVMIMVSFIVLKYENILEYKLKKFNKKWAVIVSCMLYFSYRIIFLVFHKGYFAFDEFYHISTLNSNYITAYDRALYINNVVEIMCNIFGKSDLTVKLVPFCLGSISFLCCLYLLYNIYDTPYWIVTISAILIYTPYIQYNHFYIRMYIFLEALVMLNCVLLYKAEQKKGTKWEIINILLAGALTILYSMNTEDISAKAILILMGTVTVYYFGRNYVDTFFYKKIWRNIGILSLVLSSGVLFATKMNWIKVPSILRSLLEMGTENSFYYSTSPVVLQFIFGKYLYVTLPFVLSLLFIWKKRIENKKVLFLTAGLVLSGYVAILHNVYMIRTFAAFLPIMCVLSYLIFDKAKISCIQHIMIIIIAMILTFNLQDNFWNIPSIPNETYSMDYSQVVALKDDYKAQGYEVVTMMTYKTQSAYFDLLDADINLNLADIKIKILGKEDDKVTNAELQDEKLNNEAIELINENLEQILASNIPRVIVADDVGIAIFQLQNAELKKKCEDKYELKSYKGGTGIIVVNGR